MKISLTNIGKVKKADIEINGITVIAGENNTGKSTVGKALWSIFNSFHNIENELKKERKDIIFSKIEEFFREEYPESYLKARRKLRTTSLTREILKLIGAERTEEIEKSDIYSILVANFNKELENFEIFVKLVDDIYEILNLENDYIIKNHFQNILLSEFNNQVNNLRNQEEGSIELTIKNKKISTKLFLQKVIFLNNDDFFNLHTRAIYIDDPSIIDEFHSFIWEKNHKSEIERLISQVTVKKILENALFEKRLERINEKLEEIFKNEISFNFQEGTVKLKGVQEEMHIRNLSTGLKTFAILKNLIQNGALEKNGTLILDEPEIHLHPEWQLIFAEIIVLLHKELGLHILLATHSPYFLRAIQVFTKKYEVVDKCKYYLAENIEDLSIIKDTTSEIETIFQKLASPFQKLEDIAYEEY
mgnify:CR=1 FL=1